MLTLFACPKPFTQPHIARIQRNAITSWTRLQPRPEILLLGDEPGTAAIGAELGLRHVPGIARNEQGTPLVNALFETAQREASGRLLCYLNADIVLMDDFQATAQRLTAGRKRLLVIGGRWDLELTELIDFTAIDWQARLRERVAARGRLMRAGADYFLFARGVFPNIPPFALGRTTWDNWLLWRAQSVGAAVVDATAGIMAVHQNHATAADWAALCATPEARRNRQLASDWAASYTPADAAYELVDETIRRRFGACCKRRCQVLLDLLRVALRPHAARLGLRGAGLNRLRSLLLSRGPV